MTKEVYLDTKTVPYSIDQIREIYSESFQEEIDQKARYVVEAIKMKKNTEYTQKNSEEQQKYLEVQKNEELRQKDRFLGDLSKVLKIASKWKLTPEEQLSVAEYLTGQYFDSRNGQSTIGDFYKNYNWDFEKMPIAKYDPELPQNKEIEFHKKTKEKKESYSSARLLEDLEKIDLLFGRSSGRKFDTQRLEGLLLDGFERVLDSLPIAKPVEQSIIRDQNGNMINGVYTTLYSHGVEERRGIVQDNSYSTKSPGNSLAEADAPVLSGQKRATRVFVDGSEDKTIKIKLPGKFRIENDFQ